MRRWAAAALFSLALWGCDDDSSEGGGGAGGAGGHGHLADGGGGSGGVQADAWQPGLMKMGAQGLMVRLDTSDPDPLTRTQHTWAFTVMDGQGPQAGCAVTVTPFMPDHGHGANTPPTVSEVGDGAYQASPIDLFMRGLWTVSFALTCGDVTDEVQFAFWIED
ncbi:MAG: FixH family protein [Myxococcales bacterium]|nr:FixH family protein [Myxococcales bacterium]